MAVLNSILNLSKEMVEWRRHLHTIPELGLKEFKTSEFISNKLKEWNIQHECKMAETGIVATIKGKKGNSSKSIGLRADIDALPIEEKNDFNHKSKHKGISHKCGHDGHTTLLLGAAKHLSENQDFNGTVHLIFQPAEEGIGGADIMINEGLFKKYPMDMVYGMHNWPELPIGQFSVCNGPIMAAANTIQIKIKGKGGHAAMPHQTIDPIIIASNIVNSLQTISSRNIDPLDSIVLSITQFHSGTTHNIIPDEVFLEGSLRTLNNKTKEYAYNKIKDISNNISKGFSAVADVSIDKGYPVTINSSEETAIAANSAAEIVGQENVNTNMTPVMGSEDFSFMLNKVPGSYICIGQKDSEHTSAVHSSDYDFNDKVIPIGVSYWIKLVQNILK